MPLPTLNPDQNTPHTAPLTQCATPRQPARATARHPGSAFHPTNAPFADINGDGKAGVASCVGAGGVRAVRNVDGRHGYPYTEAPRTIGVGFDAARTTFG